MSSVSPHQVIKNAVWAVGAKLAPGETAIQLLIAEPLQTCAPARWPAARGNVRAVAQRPFPSTMIATFKGADLRRVLCVIKQPPLKVAPLKPAGSHASYTRQGYYVLSSTL